MSSNGDLLVICDYDATWPGRFLELAERVKTKLGSLAIDVQHVGSTAVPGLSAKPVIDLDVVLASGADLPEVIRRLGSLGYTHEGDLEIEGRNAFRWPAGETRHHLYVVTADAVELRRHLAFRNALRADSALRNAYSDLKKTIAARCAGDRQAYTEAKSAFIKKAIEFKTFP